VPDWDSADSRDSDEDAAWRDLIARFDAPAPAQQPVPWPDREDMPPRGSSGAAASPEAEEIRAPHEPEVIRAVWPARGVSAPGAPPQGGPGTSGTAADDDDEHFVPPAPPPLPRLDPVTKGAWAALFGGPGYLFVATAAGWTVPAFGAFCAVAAFVAGFAILVLRMHERDPGGPDDGDDGAVVLRGEGYPGGSGSASLVLL